MHSLFYLAWVYCLNYTERELVSKCGFKKSNEGAWPPRHKTLAQISTFGLTERAHGIVDRTGWANSVFVDRPDNKLVLCFWK